MHCAQTEALELTHCVLAQVLGMNFALLEKTPYSRTEGSTMATHPHFSRKKYEDGKYDDKNEKAVFQTKERSQSK